MSWPGDVLWVVHVVYDFFSNVNHDQTMFCVVHVDYGVVPQVDHEQTMFFVFYVNYYATSFPRSIMTNDVLRGSRGLRPRLRGQWPDGVLVVEVDVDYVLIDDVNYDQTTRLNHTFLADHMTPVRIIGPTLSKKNSK